MKSLSKPIWKEYAAVKIFLPDLESIEKVLKESAKDFEIKTNDYSFSSIEELKEKYKNQKISELEISASNPYIVIELKRLWVRLYCGSDEIKDAGVFYKLDSIISTASRKPHFLYSYYTVYLGSLIIWILSFFTIKDKYGLLSVILAILFGIWVCWLSYIRIMKSSEIILVHKGDFRSFFPRNKDSIVVGILSAIIGVLLTTVVTNYSSIMQLLHVSK